MWKTVASNARSEMVKIWPFLLYVGQVVLTKFDFSFVLSLFIIIMNTRHKEISSRYQTWFLLFTNQ